MREEWKKYLLNKVQLRDIVNKKKKPKDSKPKGFGILDGVTPITPAQNAETTSISKQEHDALLAAASKLRNVSENDHVKDTPQPDIGGQGSGKRKRKVGIRKVPVVLDDVGVQNNDKEESVSDKIGMSDSKNKVNEDETNPVSTGRFSEIMEEGTEIMEEGTSVENIVLRKHTNPDVAARTGKPLPPVHFYALESDQPILDILKPSIVIVYHPDVAFVRQIEVYKAENSSKRLKVYFLFYEDSTEVQKFEASIRRENGAFESLIRQKSMMMIPVDQVCLIIFIFTSCFSFMLLVASCVHYVADFIFLILFLFWCIYLLLIRVGTV